MEDISKCYDEKEIDEVLTSLSPTIEGLYERRLTNVARKDIDRLRHLFYWISLAERRLSPRELAAAPGVNLRSPEDIFIICPRGLVFKEEKRHRITIIVTDPEGVEGNHENPSEDEDSATPSSQSVDEFVVFDHPSVKRFLMSKKLGDSKGLPSKFFIAENEVHVELAELILQYLLTIQESNPSTAFLESQPFLSYAATHLIPHLQKASPSKKDGCLNTPHLLDFFGSPVRPAYTYWMQTVDPLGVGTDSNLANCPSPLYAAVHLKLQIVIDHLLATGSFINSPGSKSHNPFHLAVTQKDYDLALKLITRGADPNQVNSENASPLYSAIGTGVKVLVQGLLDAGARIDNREGKYGNALQYACILGSFEIVKMLLEYSADVNAQGGYFGVALQAASAIGHEEIVELLLNAKANPNIHGGVLGNSIQAAVTGGHTRVVERLVASGVAFDAQTDLVWTEAFHKFRTGQNEYYHWNQSWQLGRSEISKDHLTESQQLLAASFVVFNSLSSEEQRIFSRLESDKSRRILLRNKSDDDKTSVPKLIVSVRKASKIGLEGQNTAGFHAKAILHAWVIRCLVDTVLSQRPEYNKPLLQAFQIVDSRIADQSVIENDSSGIYAAARVELIALYEAAFAFFATYGALIGKHKIWRFLTPQHGRSMEEALQPLITQDKRFSSAMIVANAGGVANKTANINARMLSQLQAEIKRINDHLDDHVQKPIEGMEERILNVIREELPQMIREEFRKVFQEYGMPKSGKDGS